MKTNYLKTNWLALVLGVVVVGGGLVAATTSVKLERQLRAHDEFGTMLDRLYADQRLCVALKSLHEGKAEEAAQRLDQLFCESILRLDAELPSADERARAYVEDSFRRFALVRPKPVAQGTDGSAPRFSEDQAAAERILGRVAAGAHMAQIQ